MTWRLRARMRTPLLHFRQQRCKRALPTAPAQTVRMRLGLMGRTHPLCRQAPRDAPQPLQTSAHENVRRVSDFAMADDWEFIEAAYRFLLGREADDTAHSYYDRLQRGYLSRVEVLHEIASTPEAKQRGARIEGLTLRYLLIAPFRVRFLGYGLRIISGLIRLPRHVRTIYDLTRSAARAEAVVAELAASQRRIEEAQRGISEAIEHHGKILSAIHHWLEVFVPHATSRIGRLGIEFARRAEERTTKFGRACGSGGPAWCQRLSWANWRVG